jgi:glutamine synthetase
VPNVVLNLIVAESLDDMADMLDKKLEGKKRSKQLFEQAVAEVLSAVIKDVRPVIFGGDNYSEDWHREAERRGLLNLRTTVDALERFSDDKNVALFERYGVLTPTELHSRYEIWL